MSASSLTRKGQVTIPKPIRDRLGLRQGDKVFFLVREDHVVLKALRGNILELKGSIKPLSQPEDFEAIRRKVKKAVSSKVAKNGDHYP